MRYRKVQYEVSRNVIWKLNQAKIGVRRTTRTPGTPNIAGIIGLSAAVSFIESSLPTLADH
jgi:cysteine sulfinate desulfinase/cysteine desulfurase-like protein